MEATVESYKQEPNREEEMKEVGGEIKAEKTQSVFSEPATLMKQEKADEPYPESYRTNSPDEIRLLDIAHNFQRQLSHLYPERRPLLLCPFNECGVKKFVSTTLRPSPINHPELFTWEGCARFLADFLSLVPLDPPEDLPRMLSSSSTVLRTQTATCFEFASVLCSLLIGAHYDAYCVSGYAVREMCLQDQSLQQCPLLDTPVKRETPAEELQENKYAVKPKRELRSRFLMQQEEKKQEEEVELPQEQVEQRPADPLRGLRRHCWVLVLSGRRDIQENFFIDPLTGNRYPTNNDNFLGIDSVWNDLNYYTNMQDCRDGCASMVYNLDDINHWEPVLFGARSKKQLIQEVEKRRERKKTSVREGQEEKPRVFEMPRSWVSCITISRKDLENSFPEKKKVTLYRRAKLERFAVYLRKDGLVRRLTTYKDLDRSEEVGVKEWYQHRKDYLEEREVDKVNGVTTERFRHGRRFHFLVHRYTDTEHYMEFNRAARVDDLVRRVETIREMTEFFEGRRDFLYYRHVLMDRHTLSSEQDLVTDQDNQWIQKVVERFHRNTSKPATEDVAERVFLLAQRQIEVRYHVEDNRVIPSKRCFIKPQEGTETEKAEDFRADMVSSFMMDPFLKPLSTLALYELLKALISEEEETVLQIIRSVREMKNIVACRKQEEESVELHLSPWTTAGAAKARSLRQEMERLAAEEQRWLQQQENDILAPFLIKLNNPTTLTCSEAQQLHQECLTDLQERLVEQANLIQERYEKVTQELQKKQQWYQKNQLTMTHEEETEYQSYCSEKTLQIQVTKKRLEMHKEAASQKYSSFDKTLREDPRLAPHLKS
ncbi:dynein regulatory complex subunit 7 [Cheilinus undulatus]|uniref:dynein regulatory complex subunit 7 n=1 Tax=Cheilinus undulatus TaxID=241271 RepID=UPI001BD267F0|nr:dynein regulatory complex subunit 7 [Cheilinus undulatus]